VVEQADWEEGQIVGTPAYMAPEQAAGRVADIGPATDVYALGNILYQLLTGRPPVQGATIVDLLEKVRAEPPMPPSRLHKVPRAVEAVCLRCLQKAPSQRYATAAALADDLRRFLAGESLQGETLSLRQRVFRWLSRQLRRPTSCW
jgi:serine/threonine protein kinase